MKLGKPKIELPSDVDKECLDLCNELNRLPGLETFDSCWGHGTSPFVIFFKCDNIDTISRLGRTVDRRYSDGMWRIEVDSLDLQPRGCFALTAREILDKATLEESIRSFIESINYWFSDQFDSYFLDDGRPKARTLDGFDDMYMPLHLVLKGKWYDMIVNGDKCEEYRDFTKLYRKRLCHHCDITGEFVEFKPYTHIVIHRGYTNTTATYPITSMRLGFGNAKWGAPEDKKVFIIGFKKD